MFQLIRFLRDVKLYLSRAARLMAPYWKSEEKRTAWGLLTLVVAVTIASIYVTVLITFFTRDFFSAMQALDRELFFSSLLKLFPAAAIAIVFEYFKTHVLWSLKIHWRRWLTDTYVGKYMSGRNYYQLQLKDYEIDNPDQRISEDLRNATSETLDLLTDLIRVILNLVTFMVLLWTLSGSISFTLFDTELTIPGYMAWAAILYAAVGTWIGHKIAKPLIPLNNEMQKVEADFRFKLVRVRENTEGIALTDGEALEQREMKHRFGAIWKNYFELLKYTKRLFAFRSFFMQHMPIFPTLIAAPKIFSGVFDLGNVMQINVIFMQVESNLSWFLTSYDRIARWKASMDRFLTFQEAIENAQADRASRRFAYNKATENSDGLSVRGVDVQLPNGGTLLRDVDLTFAPGQHVLIRGSSGCGKSTFFRVLSGLWPWGDGELNLPNETMMFVPQQPYLPEGTLIDAICYPSRSSKFSRQQVEALMERCHMNHLIDELETAEHWEKKLSGGEKQRVSLLRVLLHKPKWVFLDESTSALDHQIESDVYEVLQDELGDSATIASIAHRQSLIRFHDRILTVDAEAKKLIDTAPAPA